MTTPADGIRWPPEFDPSRAPIHVRNELDITAAPEVVFAWLARATAWPSYYANASKVRLDGGGDTLAAGRRFTWKTFGVNLVSVVQEWVPGERLAWNARGLGVWAYHAWRILPTPAGCHLLTEETQYGVLSRLGDLFLPRRMGVQHQLWLEGLARQAAAGPPAP